MKIFFDFFNSERPFIPKDSYLQKGNFESKSFTGTNKVILSNKKIESEDITKTIYKRSSLHLPILKKHQVSFDNFSYILRYALCVNETKKYRTYPSGGAKYPILTYVLVFDVQELNQGFYHLNNSSMTLEELKILSPKEIDEIKNSIDADYKEASFIIFFSFLGERNIPKYGSLAYKLALLEAGHMAQNVILIGEALNIHSRPSLTFDFNYINTLFNINADQEYIFYSVIF